jgi:hypothetical protein
MAMIIAALQQGIKRYVMKISRISKLKSNFYILFTADLVLAMPWHLWANDRFAVFVAICQLMKNQFVSRLLPKFIWITTKLFVMILFIASAFHIFKQFRHI